MRSGSPLLAVGMLQDNTTQLSMAQTATLLSAFHGATPRPLTNFASRVQRRRRTNSLSTLIRALDILLASVSPRFLVDILLSTGAAWQQYSIGNGERASAATAYLNSTVRARTNLAIVVNTYTTRVLPVTAESLDIRKVEVAPRKGGKSMCHVSSWADIDGLPLGERRVITAKKEVLLAGGAFGSAQILLNSGIGPEGDLEAVNVTLVHNSPNVGKDMQDHYAAGFTLSTRVPAPQK